MQKMDPNITGPVAPAPPVVIAVQLFPTSGEEEEYKTFIALIKTFPLNNPTMGVKYPVIGISLGVMLCFQVLASVEVMIMQ